MNCARKRPAAGIPRLSLRQNGSSKAPRPDGQPASTAYMSHVPGPRGVPPRMLRRTRLTDLVNAMAPKLVAAAFGMNPEGVLIYPAGHIDETRLNI
jgi:hypothetical protein